MGRRASLSAFSIVLVVMLLTAAVPAEIYQWTDSSGKTVFGDAPPRGSGAKEKKLPQQSIDRPAAYSEAPVRSAGGRVESRPLRDVSVIMYMTSWCSYCKKAREYISTLPGVRFVEYDVESSKSRNAEMLAKSGGSKGVPLIDVEGTIIRGFNPSAIASALADARNR